MRPNSVGKAFYCTCAVKPVGALGKLAPLAAPSKTPIDGVLAERARAEISTVGTQGAAPPEVHSVNPAASAGLAAFKL